MAGAPKPPENRRPRSLSNFRLRIQLRRAREQLRRTRTGVGLDLLKGRLTLKTDRPSERGIQIQPQSSASIWPWASMIALLICAACDVNRATRIKSPVRVACSDAFRTWFKLPRRLSISSGVIFDFMVLVSYCNEFSEHVASFDCIAAQIPDHPGGIGNRSRLFHSTRFPGPLRALRETPQIGSGRRFCGSKRDGIKKRGMEPRVRKSDPVDSRKLLAPYFCSCKINLRWLVASQVRKPVALVAQLDRASAF